jgi:hypothetical protein
MPQINPDKSYAQQPLRIDVADNIVIPDDWFMRLGNMVADDILKLNADDKNKFINGSIVDGRKLNGLNDHAGPNSTYKLKKELHDSLKVIYKKLVDPATTPDEKITVALKLQEGITTCTPGFHDRTNELVINFSLPVNADEIFASERQSIVSQAASKATSEIHTFNRFFVIARLMGYGVRPLNANDAYTGMLSDDEIKTNLEAAFATQHTLFNKLNWFYERLVSLIKKRGYDGERRAGYEYEDYHKFDNDFLKDYVEITASDLFIVEEQEVGEKMNDDDDVLVVPKVLDINWANVKLAMLQKMRDEKYFLFSKVECDLLNAMTSRHLSFNHLSPASLSLFSTVNELAQTLAFFNHWPTRKKVGLVLNYLKGKSAQEQEDILKKLADVPALGAELQSSPDLQQVYLASAANADNLDKVKALVARGVDINPVLGVLIAKQKPAVLWWLYKDKVARDSITQVGMQAAILEGKYKGKTVANVLVDSRKGCQLLIEDERLRTLCPTQLAGKQVADWLNAKKAEKNFGHAGFFAPTVSPLVMQFLQHVVNGKQAKAEQILKNNPSLHYELLTTKTKVVDYAGRTIQGTALRIALGAEDVRYHDNEICMTEMLMPYVKALPNGEVIKAAQIAEQFPEGYEEVEKARMKRDREELDTVIAAIGRSNTDADCEAAIQAFCDYLKPKGTIKTGIHFNAELLADALELYDEKYSSFGGSDSRKNNLCWRRVIGGIECMATACLAQAICQGPYYIVEGGEKLCRSMNFRQSPGVVYFPLVRIGLLRLGHAWAGGGARGGCGLGGGLGGGCEGLRVVTKLLSRKNINRVELMPRRARRTQMHPSSSGCVIQ